MTFPRVLIVDDEAVVRHLLAEVLRDAELEVVYADCLASARAAAHAARFDVALVDKNLPDGNGLDLVRELKAHEPYLEAIVMTAYASLESAIAAVGVNAFDYLVKPFQDLHGLPRKLGNAAEKARLRRFEGTFLHEQKMDVLGRLAGGITHDFNNVLCVILNAGAFALQQVEAGIADEETAECLRDILFAGGNASRLTRQIQTFSRKPTGEPEVFELNRVVRETESLLARVLGEQLVLRCVLDPAAGHVEMPRSHFEQILVNLSVNARDAMPGKGELVIRTEANADRSTTITVKDTGVGMSREVAARIFDPFFTTKAPGFGTGIGLAVTSSVVAQAKGSITVDSVPGVGTSFRITLPTCDASLVPQVVDRARLVPGGGRSVLVVDDDEGVRRTLRGLFERADYDVTLARSAEAALAACAHMPKLPDLLVTDVVLPGMSGSVLADRLRQLQPSLRVVFVSGYPGDALDVVGAGSSTQAFVPKPFTEEALATALRRLS